MAFGNLGLTPSLVSVLESMKYTSLFPIQQEAIPAILNQQDVLGIAPTGSGKTASYVLPLLSLLENAPKPLNRHVHALVLVPTRELAVQVNEVFRVFSATLPKPVKSMAVFGGVSINPQMIALQGVSILIATPGRLLELTSSNAVQLKKIKILVLDEADKMLNLGFEAEINKIFSLLPVLRQNLLFSATLSKDILSLTRIVLRNPKVIEIKTESNNLDLIQQSAYAVGDEKKGPFLRYLIKAKAMKQVLVFTSSIYKADNVADKLRKNKLDAVAIHSKKSQGARVDALSKFKLGSLQVLVATDLMARGIDVPSLAFVVNYELPRSPKDYIHRIGRTGRAGNEGQAISLIAPSEEHHFKVIQKKMGKQISLLSSEQNDLPESEKQKLDAD
jgi:ATP-dependent RNA helicase RhlE